MTPERWKQIDQLFHAALQRGPSQRATFIAESCADDEALQKEIEDLLASHEQSESFIETPAADVAAELLTEGSAGLAVGQTIGPYKVVDLLGKGGMGQVYLGTDTRLGRRVALKVLPKQFTMDPERVRRFELEARAASALNHPNIVTIHEIGRFNGTQFIVTEFVEGQTLRQLMNEKPFAVNEALNVTIQVSSALQAAHAAGIVHRDIKPENIMLRADGYVKILDFGLAKLTETPSTDSDLETSTLLQSNPGLVMGTVQYMSPEQARGKKVDARTDIWSLGVVLYELLSRRVPFTGETPSHVMVSLMENELPPLTGHARVPAELDRIVTKALKKNKKGRYQTAVDLTHDLKNLKQELQIEARLKQSGQGGTSKEITAKSDGKEPFGRVPATATPTVDIGVAHPTSSAQYLVSEIKRHKTGVAFVSLITMILAAAAIAYFAYFGRTVSSEAIDSVAVLPFVNVSNDPNTEYLSDGLSDSIIDSLSQLPNLKKVSAFNSVLRFKGKQTDPQAVGRELNVRAVLIGRLTQHGDDLLISTELVDVKDNKRLWGGQYNRKLADVLTLQGEIAREITDRLRLKLTGEEKQRLTKPHTQSTEAYQLYLQGRYYWRMHKDESLNKSYEYFQKALEKDPNYAQAYSGLSDYWGFMGAYGVMPSRLTWPKAEEAAARALAIDDTLGEAHHSLGAVKMFYYWDWPGAESEFKRAIELEPEFNSYGLYARLMDAMGRFDEAIAMLKRSDEIGATSAQPGGLFFLGTYLYHARRYDQAIEAFRKVLEKGPSANIRAQVDLANVYVKQERYGEALAEMDKVRPRPTNLRLLGFIGYVYAASGKRDEATKILEQLKASTTERFNLLHPIALIYAGLGNKDEALAWLDKACEARSINVVDLKVDPRFDTLRSDPRFTNLLRRMKLAT